LPNDLLFGPYTPPALCRGDFTFCLFRDTEVKVTSISHGRIQWPRCQRMGQRGGSGLLVTEELIRAIKTESSLALQYWFGVGAETVWRWRRFFGISQWEPEGSRRLHQELSENGAAAVRRKTFTPAERTRYRAAAIARGTRPNRWKETGWTRNQLDLLGRLPDQEVAIKIGRTANAVRV